MNLPPRTCPVAMSCMGCLALCLLLATPCLAGKKKVRVNIGTIAPRGSTYHRSLQTMAEQWSDISDEAVRVVIFPDGTMGGESDMVRHMRQKKRMLHGALLTAHGLSDIEPTVTGLQSMPLRFRNLKEFEYVNEQLRPVIEPRIESKGFVVLTWTDAGWVRYFSRKPILYPDDLKSQKVFAWEGNPGQIRLMENLGLNPIELDTGGIQMSLGTGLIDVVAMPPIFALAGQIDQHAPHMLHLNWAPMVGAVVIHRETWMQIPEVFHDDLLEAAEAAGKQIQSSSRKESAESVAAMEKRGLKVHEVTQDMQAAWDAMAEAELLHLIRGSIVPEETFDDVQRIVRQYRSREKATAE